MRRLRLALLVMVIRFEVWSAADCQDSEDAQKCSHLLEIGFDEAGIGVNDCSSQNNDRHPKIVGTQAGRRDLLFYPASTHVML
jgi:hypothetical protein